ncbi:unnamed protein product [Symbiodinium sp. CCMP2592]|nr:unnamed protein product [Symbiodinium sp. CCMP2592]
METLAADDDQYRRLTADEQDFLNMFHKKAQEFDVAHETMSRLFRYLDLVLHSLGVALPSAAALCASDVLKWRYGAAILSLCGTMCWVVTARAQCGVQQYRHMMLHQKFAEFDHDIRMIFAFDKLNQPTDRVVAVANKYASVLYQSRDAILPHWMHQELSNCAILTANLGQHEPRLPSTKTHLTQQQVANHIDPCVRQAEVVLLIEEEQARLIQELDGLQHGLALRVFCLWNVGDSLNSAAAGRA